MRNELGRALGTELPGTLVFDYPTAAALAVYIASLTPASPEGEQHILVVDSSCTASVPCIIPGGLSVAALLTKVHACLAHVNFWDQSISCACSPYILCLTA